MSVFSTESSLHSAFSPPSLVFPSLYNSNNNRQRTSKYSSKDSLRLDGNNNNIEDPSANSKNLQSCIHYASRLIKLRSELRSPSYMNRSNSATESGGNTIGHLFYKSNCSKFETNGRNNSSYELSTTSKSSTPDQKTRSNSISNRSLLSDIGRAQSLPNVAQRHLFNYDKEDESEIFCQHSKMVPVTVLEKAHNDDDDDQDDDASQLTYLSDLVRASLRRRQTNFHESSDHLALPPRHYFNSSEKESRPRSISLRDMINEAIVEATQPTNSINDNTTKKPTVLKNSQSFTLASQLLYASQNNYQPLTDHSKGQQQNEEIKTLLLADKKEFLFAVENDKNQETTDSDNYYNGVFDEKVEISSATSPISTDVGYQCNRDLIDTIIPQPTKSRDNKSLFSVISSDSELEEDDDDDTKTNLSIHSFNKRIIQKRRLQKRPQAFLVSISPSSAAAASVARSRRSKTKQTIRAHLSQDF